MNFLPVCSSFVLMWNFAKPYRKVAYFGLWAEESADQYGKRDAMAILADAVDCGIDDDPPMSCLGTWVWIIIHRRLTFWKKIWIKWLRDDGLWL